MKKIEYRVIWQEDLEKHLKEWPDNYEEPFSCLVLFKDGKQHKLIGTDGGEPEDQTLFRDWNWVADALNQAYQQGIKDATKENKDD